MLLIVGWDGACFELADRFRAEGRMPVLDALLARGRAWQVPSTIPAVTFPAWTSFLTGAEPSHHGVTDFTIPKPGAYEVRFANATHRRLPTILAQMSAAGLRVGMYGMPATWPLEGCGVFEICGFDTPLGASSGRRAVHPPELADELRGRFGRLGIEGIAQGRIGAGWHEQAAVRLLDDIALRTTIACDLIGRHALDVFVVHFMEPDTASHHFWHLDDPASPRHLDGAASQRDGPGPRGVLGDVYAALDRCLGQLIEGCGAAPDVMLLSDHGSAGASDRIVFWNRWLADRGLLAFRGDSASSLPVAMRRAAMQLIPARWQARAFAAAGALADRVESRARFAGIDWSRSAAYSDEVPYFPSIRLNLRGRDPQGTVAAADRERVLAGIERELLEARDPFDGGAVVSAVRRREELFDGPFAERYPDLVLELRRPGGYAYCAGSSAGGREPQWLRRLHRGERSGAKGTASGGVHTRVGMAVIAAAGVEASRAQATASLPDLGVTALALVGLAPSAQMQGRSVIDRSGLHAPPPLQRTAADVLEYDADEEREVAERLRALGYLP